MGLEPTYDGFANLPRFPNSVDAPTAFAQLAKCVANSEPTMAGAFLRALVGMVDAVAAKDGRSYGAAALSARMAVTAVTAGSHEDGVEFATMVLSFAAGASGAGRGEVGEEEVV